jgi:hypothetical protein
MATSQRLSRGFHRLALAASTAAIGFAQVARIKSTNPGSGGSRPSLGGGSAAKASTQTGGTAASSHPGPSMLWPSVATRWRPKASAGTVPCLEALKFMCKIRMLVGCGDLQPPRIDPTPDSDLRRRGLESRCAVIRTVGSNPTLSANFYVLGMF